MLKAIFYLISSKKKAERRRTAWRMQTAGSLIKKTFGSDKDELKEKESGKERHREEGEKEKEKEGPEAGIESDEEEETHSALETEYPDMLMVLPAEDFEVKDYGVKEDDSKAEKFLRKKIGTTLDNAKVYKKRYDGFDKKKKVVATIGSPILSTAISIRSSFEDPKTRAELLERRLKGTRYLFLPPPSHNIQDFSACSRTIQIWVRDGSI